MNFSFFIYILKFSIDDVLELALLIYRKIIAIKNLHSLPLKAQGE